jgi:hypothetical protein
LKRKKTGQKRPKITRTSYVSLPKELVHDIQSLPLTKTQISHCIKFVGILYRDSIEEFWDATIPTPKPQRYLTKTFGDKYYQWLNILIEKDVVNRSDNYSQLNHLCYTYVVNPKYQSDLIKSIQSNSFNVLCKEKYSEPLLTVGYKDVIKEIDLELTTYINWFIKDINSLKIDYDLLYYVIKTHLDNIEISNFSIDEEILPINIGIKQVNGKVVYKNVKNVLASLNKGECLIKDKKNYKIVFPEQFLAKKKTTMLMYYVNSVERLKKSSFSVKRNTTNNRLDTNLTNMASVLVDEICRQNKLGQIDLSNSQFTLLTNELNKDLDTSDFKLFKELTSSGKLYDYIANELGIKNKKNSKVLMFEIMFSNHRSNSAYKKKIKALFPSVIGWIDQYKKVHGDEKFSVMLQLKESHLFIDRIYKRIKKAKLLCFSKHDSMIVSLENIDPVLKIMQEEFAIDNLSYRLKVTTPENEYYIHSDDEIDSLTTDNGHNAMIEHSHTEYFKYMPPTYNLSPSEFHSITKWEYSNTISFSKVCSMAKDYNSIGFDKFWEDLNKLENVPMLNK